MLGPKHHTFYHQHDVIYRQSKHMPQIHHQTHSNTDKLRYVIQYHLKCINTGQVSSFTLP